MRKYLLILPFLFAFINLNAQSVFNRSYHAINERPNPFLIEINGSSYYTATRYDANYVGWTYLYKHDKGGVLKFKSPCIAIPNYAIKAMDNKLVTFGTYPICDVLGPTQLNFINKIDTNGNSVFLTTYTITPYDNYKTSLQYSDSSYFSFTDSVLFKNSKTGQFVSKTNLGLTKISSSLLLQNGTILLSAKQGTMVSLVVIATSGATISAKPFPVLLNKLMFYGGQKIIGLGIDGKLYKISPNYNLISSSSFSAGLSANGFECKNDTLYSVLNSATVLSNYAVSDTSFNIISLTSTTTQSLSQTAICLNGSKIAILSEGISSTATSFYPHFFSSLNQINKFSSNNFTHDLAIVSVTADSSFAQCYQIYNCASYLRAKVKVINVGSTVINNFKLNCYLYPRVDCGYYYYQEKFDQLSIQPGDSLVVTTNTFVAKTILSVTSPTSTVQYCFYTTLPNEETDKTFIDNTLCQIFTFNTNYSSLKEISNDENKTSIFPNPFQNTIFIESDLEIKNIEVINCLGLVLNKQTPNKNKVTLENFNSIPGIYFIKIETENGTQIKKVIKQ